MEKKPKLSFQRPVGTQVKDAVEQEPIRAYEPVEKKIEYQPQEQGEEPTQIEASIEGYIESFIYFHNFSKEKNIPQEQVLFLWQVFLSPSK